MKPRLSRSLLMRTLMLAAFVLTAAGAAAQTPSFEPPTGYGVPLVPWYPMLSAKGDFNNDGHVDLLASNGDRVQVLLGTGTGTLGTLRTSYLSRQLNAWNVAVGDIDNDGDLDLAGGSNGAWGAWYLLVARGNGDGTFADVVSHNMPCCGGVRTTTFVDLDNDGWLDMVGGESNWYVRVFINQAGTFPLNGSSTLVQSGNNPQDAAVGDFNNDGQADIVLANRDAGGSLQVYLNNGTSTPSPQPLLTLAPGEAGRNLAAADLNADGCDDLANINWGGRAVDVYLSHCTGSFSTLTSYNFDPVGPTAANGYRIADEIVDLDGDGKRDLVVSNSAGRGRNGKAIFVLPGNGDGTFGTASSHPNPVEPPAPACCAWVNENLVFPIWAFAADLDEDGRPDLITTANNDRPVAVMLNSSAGADADGDGVPDDEDAFPDDPSESADTDGDNVGDNGDNCSALANADQANTDGDGSGDACDVDDDNDGVADGSDAFPLDAGESVDTDHDGTGDNADTDDDGDGVADGSDAFPLDPGESVDTDHDGIGNNADTDDDNDGVPDTSDPAPTNPDRDGDGALDGADPYPDSITSPTVIVNGNDSGVVNRPIATGTTLADSVTASSASCAAGAGNHGAYVSCMAHALNALKAAGTITGAEKGALQSAAAKK